MEQIGLLFGLFAIILIINLKPNDAIIFKLTNFECQSYNQSWFVINQCRLKVIQRNRIGAYFNGSVLYPADNILVRYQVLKKANGYKPWVINGKVDICRYLKSPYNPTAKLIGSLFLDFTNFNHTCPYYGVQLLNGFYLRPELLKLPLPTGDYKLVLSWHFDKKLQFETNASFTFAENIIDQCTMFTNWETQQNYAKKLAIKDFALNPNTLCPKNISLITIYGQPILTHNDSNTYVLINSTADTTQVYINP